MISPQFTNSPTTNSLSLNGKPPRISILFTLRMQENKKGNATIYCRITDHNGRRSVFSTGIPVMPQQWNQSEQYIEGEHASIQNLRLSHVKTQLEALHFQLFSSNLPTSAGRVKDCFLRGANNYTAIPTFLECLRKIVTDQYEKMTGNGIERSTLKSMRALEKKLIMFVQDYYQVKDLALKEVKPAFATDALNYFKGTRRFGHNYCLKILILAKKVLRYAYECEYINRNPLAQFKPTKERPKPIVHLEEHELAKLMEYDFVSEKLSRVRDCFVFGCFTGLSYSDLFNLHPTHFKQDKQGRLSIVIDRQKTGTTSYIPLFPAALKIIDKYRFDLECLEQGKMLPVISNQKYNVFLKEIGAVLGFKQHLTSHVARKTAAMLLLNNGMPIETVSLILGHSSIKMTQTRYAQVKQQKVASDFDKFLTQPNLLTQ